MQNEVFDDLQEVGEELTVELAVTPQENGTRLDSFLARDGVTRSAAARCRGIS